MDYQFKDIENKWQQFWAGHQTFKADNNAAKPKYYVLDMFPYPSGAGLHVGHPLGYIASDIFSRYKRLKGFNVLHPMGYDSFGLPAEQYAIQTGQHPALTTEQNIATYRRQLDQLGFSFDWSREVRTSSPDYYKWTQWIFMQLFNSWYNKDEDKAEPIDKLIAHFGHSGSSDISAICDDEAGSFTAAEWNAMGEEKQQTELLKYRLTYLRESTVNWCPALGTVLANDEVKDGFSERGGYPVVQKKMMQWSMRITAYAERLLQGLDTIDWPEPLKEMQRNWIGKSAGASVRFPLEQTAQTASLTDNHIEVFTTRVDTIFGVTFVVLAPEHELVASLTTPEQKTTVEAYIEQTKKKSELDRMADTKTVSGAFTGSYVLNPLNGEKIQLWIADYVLAGYGTGAVMAVPSGDQRDYLFAKHFSLPIVPIIDIQNIEKEADPTKEGKYINSGFINGLTYKEATGAVVAKLEGLGAGKAKINYRMRDAIFGRQRYWGEPVPVYFKNGLPYLIDESELPLILPEIDKYLPTESGEPPLGRAEGWKYSLTPALSKGERVEKNPSKAYGYETADKALWDILKDNARSNRSNATEAEDILWQYLRNHKTGFKIRRQHAIDTYIADFICLSKGLIIEIDGGYHHLIQEQDEIRTRALKKLGFEVIRFSNEDIIQHVNTVVQTITAKLINQPDRELNESVSSGSLSFGEGWGEAFPYELSTMPGWAGSSWYWYRYMDARDNQAFADPQAIAYWQDVDLYIGGSEHATGHLLYSRFWNKFLKDIGLAIKEEPFKKLINQGMIQGRSSLVYRLVPILINTDDSFVKPEVYVSKGIYELYKEGDFDTIEQIALFYKDLLPQDAELGEMDFTKLHVDVNIVNNDALDINAFRKWRTENAQAILILEDGTVSYATDTEAYESKFICEAEVEKMSKSKYNVVNPDQLVERYGADTLRMYEMFLGPLEQSKPWNTNGIEGVFKFLRKFWRLFHNEQMELNLSNEAPTKAELKALHKIIRKVEEDMERFSFNTSVSSFMIAVNELTDLKCNKSAVLQDMVILLSPYAPHICEELWTLLGNPAGSISYATYPAFNPAYLVEDDFAYPISVNGKTKINLSIPLSFESAEVETFVLAQADVQKYLDGKTPKKVIVVKGRIVNIVL